MKVAVLFLFLAVVYVKAHEPYCYDPALIVNNVRERPAALTGNNRNDQENDQTVRQGFVREATGVPAIALEKCPGSGWFHYYDCCDDDDKRRCCFNFRWFFLLLFILPWFLLLLGCIGGLGALMSRKRKNRRGSRREDRRHYDRNVQTFGNPNREVHYESKEHARNIPIGGERVEEVRREHHEREIPIRMEERPGFNPARF